MNDLKLLDVAVLLITYKRIDTTKQVFKAIQKAKPSRLYISSNIAKTDKENKDVYLIRKYLEANINWKCDIKKMYRSEHLNAKQSISGAINWFFENEKMGIILEDDCLPSQSFFRFSEEMLNKYKDDMRIGQISGTNILGEYSINQDSYHFSNFGSIWGWATWRRAWALYDIEMKTWPFVRDNKLLKSVIINDAEYGSRIKSFEKTYTNKIDTWDFQWIYTRLINHMLIIIPSKNLISNIGFSSDATHTNDQNSALNNQDRYDDIFPLNHPMHFIPNKIFEELAHSKKTRFLLFRVINKLKRDGLRKAILDIVS